MKPVVFNPLAVEDLNEITDHIASDNPVAATSVRSAILLTAETLGQQPGLGTRPRFSTPRFAGIRFFPASSYPQYLLFYQELDSDVEVLRILHGSRNLPPLFNSETRDN